MSVPALVGERAKLRSLPGWPISVVLMIAAPLALFGPRAAQFVQAVVAVAGVQMLAGEYATGMISPSLRAVPRRRDLLGAKAVWLLAGVLGPALVLFPRAGFGRVAAGTVLYLGLVALIGLGVGALVRSVTASAGIVLGLLYLVPVAVRLVTEPAWGRALYRIGPSTAGLTVQSPTPLIGPWQGLSVAAAWAVGFLVLGGLRFLLGSSSAGGSVGGSG